MTHKETDELKLTVRQDMIDVVNSNMAKALTAWEDFCAQLPRSDNPLTSGTDLRLEQEKLKTAMDRVIKWSYAVGYMNDKIGDCKPELDPDYPEGPDYDYDGKVLFIMDTRYFDKFCVEFPQFEILDKYINQYGTLDVYFRDADNDAIMCAMGEMEADSL